VVFALSVRIHLYNMKEKVNSSHKMETELFVFECFILFSLFMGIAVNVKLT